MDFLKFHKKKVLISLVSASMVFLGLSYYYSMPERKKFHFHRRKNGKPSFSEKIREFFNPLLFFARRRREKHEIIAEIQTNKLAEIIKRSENEGKEFKEVVEIYDKTEENLEKIDFKALNFNAKFKGKKRKGKKKLKKAQYLHLKEQRNKLKEIVEELYSFNRGPEGKDELLQ